MNDVGSVTPVLTGRIVDLRNLLDDLVEDGRLQRTDANLISGQTRSREQSAMHPLSYIASLNLEDAAHQGRVLDEAHLSQWMADKAGLELVHINPLKIKAAEVTEVMSYAFAKRHGILCIQVTPDEVVIACTQPFVDEWIPQIEHTSKRHVRRVFVLPSDVQRYTLEYYSLSKSISGATGVSGPSVASNFEQLLELGNLKDIEANDQHIVNIVDWLLQYAFDQRASDIHLEPRREVGPRPFSDRRSFALCV